MEFTFIMLSALVAVSEQQFRQHPGVEMFWLAPYYSPQSATINDYLSSNYNNDELEMLFFRQLQRTDPGREEADTKLRNKELNRYQPLPPNNARFVLNFSSRTHLLNKVNTITFTITSSVTFTKVQSCIPSNQFSPNFASVICRRKRAEMVESITNWKDIQLAIKPTYVQPVEPTVISALNPLTGTAQLPLISSSKDEDLLNEKQSSQEMPLSKQSRMKRLFFHLVTTTTVVSYTFFSATSTKTVSLLSVAEQGPGYYLICRPEGFSVCSSPSTINT